MYELIPKAFDSYRILFVVLLILEIVNYSYFVG